MQIHKIETASDGRELTIHGSEDFPCASYDEKFSQFVGGEVPWHWHDEIELVFVVEGATKVECVGVSDVISRGELVVINASALHRLTDVGEPDCHILNAVFSPQLIGGLPYSRIYTKYVSPLLNNASFVMYKFTPEVEWQRVLIKSFEQAFAQWKAESPGYEMIMTSTLIQCWQQLCSNEPELLNTQVASSVNEQRLQTLLHYIHQHYGDSLSVAQISQAANISESECYRLFKSALKCTPNSYLLSYRLRQSTSMLVESPLPITEIAHQCGFNCPAYYAKKFRVAYGKTPRDFRREGRAN